MKTRTFYAVVVLLIAFFLAVTYFWPECTTVKFLDTSVSVKDSSYKVIGLTTDTDYLKFGTASQESMITRSINMNHSVSTAVDVIPTGEFAQWLEGNIRPESFYLKKGHNQEVFFRPIIPYDAEVGDYSGKVYFCYREGIFRFFSRGYVRYLLRWGNN